MPPTLRFKGLSITKEQFQNKYDVQLSDVEWQSLVSLSTKSWEEGVDELRLMVFRHIRSAMEEIGYRPVLEGKEVKFGKG